MNKKNPYKVFGDYLIDLTKDHIEGEVLEDMLLEQKHEGYASPKDYEEGQSGLMSYEKEGGISSAE